MLPVHDMTTNSRLWLYMSRAHMEIVFMTVVLHPITIMGTKEQTKCCTLHKVIDSYSDMEWPKIICSEKHVLTHKYTQSTHFVFEKLM